MTTNEWMNFLVDNYEELQRLCIKDRKFDEDAWNVVLDRLPRIYELYDPEKGSRIVHAKSNLRWYIFKQRTKKSAVKYVEFVPESPVVEDHALEQDASNLVTLLRAELTEYEFYVFYYHHGEGYTLRQIAKACGLAASGATVHADLQIINAKVERIRRGLKCEN
jgi:hypothetical protein